MVSDPEKAGTPPSNTPDKTDPDIVGAWPDGATPDADGTLGLSVPADPTAASTSAEPMESAPTEQDLWELDVSILDLLPGEADDFDGANLDFVAALVEDDGEKTAEHIAKSYNPEAEMAPENQDYLKLELGVGSLELGDSDSDLEESPTRESVPAEVSDPVEVPAHNPAPPSEDVEMSERGEPLPKQPGLKISERHIQIREVGLFRCRMGQPISLRAYPWLERPAVPLAEGKPQAYTGQDRHDPTGLYPRSTQKERQQARDAEQRATTCRDAQDPAYNPGHTLEHPKYVGETLIQRMDQPWTWGLEAGADHYSLEMCNITTMTAI